ncbi:hypothetical protein M1446_02400 [Candidatus Dependentiae bacterium]|nr:hypothetical protein [Candidatus Dependentiae bacterium]
MKKYILSLILIFSYFNLCTSMNILSWFKESKNPYMKGEQRIFELMNKEKNPIYLKVFAEGSNKPLFGVKLDKFQGPTYYIGYPFGKIHTLNNLWVAIWLGKDAQKNPWVNTFEEPARSADYIYYLKPAFIEEQAKDPYFNTYYLTFNPSEPKKGILRPQTGKGRGLGLTSFVVNGKKVSAVKTESGYGLIKEYNIKPENIIKVSKVGEKR